MGKAKNNMKNQKIYDFLNSRKRKRKIFLSEFFS